MPFTFSLTVCCSADAVIGCVFAVVFGSVINAVIASVINAARVINVFILFTILSSVFKADKVRRWQTSTEMSGRSVQALFRTTALI